MIQAFLFGKKLLTFFLAVKRVIEQEQLQEGESFWVA